MSKIVVRSSKAGSNQSQFYVAIGLVTLLLFVWPVPGTIALRNILLALLAAFVFFANWRLRHQNVLASVPKWPVRILLALTVWITVVIVAWAHEPSLSWGEFWPQWVLPLIVGSVAWGLARLAIFYGKQELVIQVIFYVLFIQIVTQDLINIGYLLLVDAEPFRLASVLYVPKIFEYWFSGVPLRQAFDANLGEKVSFINNLFVGLVLAEAGQRVAAGKRWLNVSNLILVIGFFSAGLCSYWLNIRNGNAGLVLLLILFGLFCFYSVQDIVKPTKKLALIAIFLIALLGSMHLLTKNDQRWEKFVETAELVVNGESTNAWLLIHNQAVYPLLAGGSSVDGSTYLRMSWIKEGIKMIQKYPMGTGFNRNAFFDTIDSEYKLGGMVRGGHSHSGMIDFFLANGIVGGLLWILFLFSSALYGLKILRTGRVAQGLTVVFFAISFLHRGFVDSNIRDHVLQQFIFFILFYMSINLKPVLNIGRKQVNHEVA